MRHIDLKTDEKSYCRIQLFSMPTDANIGDLIKQAITVYAIQCLELIQAV
jgi:hypothetical protein